MIFCSTYVDSFLVLPLARLCSFAQIDAQTTKPIFNYTVYTHELKKWVQRAQAYVSPLHIDYAAALRCHHD